MDLANIIFDLDGTLVDSLAGIEYSIDSALKERGYAQRTSDLRPLIGPPIRRILSQVSGEENPQELDCLEAVFRSSYDAEGWKKTVLMRGAEQAIREAACCGRRMFLFTNKPQGATSQIVGWLGIANYFSRVICRDSGVPPYSSKADMLRLLISRDGVAAATSIVVGDTMEDFKAASEVGMAAAILTTGYGNFTDAALPTLNLFSSLNELGSVLAAVGGVT